MDSLVDDLQYNLHETKNNKIIFSNIIQKYGVVIDSICLCYENM